MTKSKWMNDIKRACDSSESLEKARQQNEQNGEAKMFYDRKKCGTIFKKKTPHSICTFGELCIENGP